MPVLFAMTASSLSSFAEGAMLAVTIYLISRGIIKEKS